MSKLKEANLLVFKVSLDILNSILTKLIEGASTVPEDLQIFRMGEDLSRLRSYYLIMSSKVFPLVKEGERVKEGIIEFNKGVLTWMEMQGVKNGTNTS